VSVRSRYFLTRTRRAETFIGASQLNSSLLTVSVIAVLLPAAFSFAFNNGDPVNEADRILSVSHGVRPFFRSQIHLIE
jgi:hypothetical protein